MLGLLLPRQNPSGSRRARPTRRLRPQMRRPRPAFACETPRPAAGRRRHSSGPGPFGSSPGSWGPRRGLDERTVTEAGFGDRPGALASGGLTRACMHERSHTCARSVAPRTGGGCTAGTRPRFRVSRSAPPDRARGPEPNNGPPLSSKRLAGMMAAAVAAAAAVEVVVTVRAARRR